VKEKVIGLTRLLTTKEQIPRVGILTAQSDQKSIHDRVLQRLTVPKYLNGHTRKEFGLTYGPRKNWQAPFEGCKSRGQSHNPIISVLE
jgi:hypothetical protein